MARFKLQAIKISYCDGIVSCGPSARETNATVLHPGYELCSASRLAFYCLNDHTVCKILIEMCLSGYDNVLFVN
jgi:hypothetical protein